jgi:hypothetical protein
MRLLSLEEAQKKLGGISLALLRKAIADGRLPAVRIGRRVFLDEAVANINERTIASPLIDTGLSNDMSASRTSSIDLREARLN